MDFLKQYLSLNKLYFKSPSIDDIQDISTKISEKTKIKEKIKGAIICRACNNLITFPDKQITVEGKHKHTFKNPANIIYHIGCYSEAQGCSQIGNPVLNYTWFPDYAWSIAVCLNCFSHLGWFYQSLDNSFYGLILDNVIENI